MASPRLRIVTIVGEEQSRDVHRRAQQPAGAAPEVEDQRLHPPAREVLDRLLQLVGRPGGEGVDPGIADRVVRVEPELRVVAGNAEAADARDRHDASRDGQLLRTTVGVPDFQAHGLALLAEDPLDDLGDIEAPDRLAVDLVDDVAGPDPGLERRRVEQRCDHDRLPVPRLELGPDTRDLTLGVTRQVGHPPGVEVLGVRIVERVEHPADRALAERRLVRGLDGDLADLRQDLGLDPDLVRLRLGGGPVRGLDRGDDGRRIGLDLRLGFAPGVQGRQGQEQARRDGRDQADGPSARLATAPVRVEDDAQPALQLLG
jgi:hypothetical protein